MQNEGRFDEIGYHMYVFPGYKYDGLEWKTDTIVKITNKLQQQRQRNLIDALNFKK